jgi:prepilin-type N-terminal cleavage/methylation domain-containing protein
MVFSGDRKEFAKYFSYQNRGFTLIETMLAMLILSVGVLGTTMLTINAIAGNVTSNRITAATTFAQERIEEIEQLGYGNADTAVGTEDYGSNTYYSLHKRVTSIAADTPAANMKTVSVQVYWRSDQESIIVRTILAK